MTEIRAKRSPLPPTRFSWEASSDGATDFRTTRQAAMEPSEANHAPPAVDTVKEGRPGGGFHPGSKRESRHRSGGFLLQNTAAGSALGEDGSGHRRKHPRSLLQSIRSKGSKKDKRKAGGVEEGLGISQPETGMHPSAPAEPEPSTSKNGAPAEEPLPPPSQDEQDERAPLDDESAQIVDMALRISQSRRAASQRVVSQHTPPRLAPLPDTSGVSSLRQHLQQQRKLSRTGSPRPERPRNGSALRHALDSFDVTAGDGSYRYHISRSTLARVQKAKEYIELMAQYRRLMGNLPPLRTAGGQRSSMALSAKGSSRSQGSGAAGRQYNPLQYIRNRKVRARERQPLDGEAQGFKDVMQVTNWVDEVVESSNADNQTQDEAQSLPTFAAAERQKNEVPSASEGSKAAAKLARRRIDWLVEPADLIADAYWLEQGNNKSLLQDRHWDPLCPRGSNASLRPSPHIEERQYLSRPVTKDQSVESTESKPKADEERYHTSPRPRLLSVRGLHHRHSSSGHNHDFLHLRRRSASDVSDSDLDLFREKGRTGTMTTSGKDILEKQMMEMIAKEERESTLRSSRSDTSPPQPTSDEPEARSNLPSRMHSRNGSSGDISEAEDKGAQEQVTPNRRPPRLRVDVPGRSRRSLDVDSAPNSPDQPPSRDGISGFSPTPSRGASPPRNRFSKVKQYFGDRKDRNAFIDDRIGEINDTEPQKWTVGPQPTPQEERETSSERRLSGSPTRKQPQRASMEGRGHLRLPSVKGKEEPMAVRGIFKAPARIDNVLRTGVSKIGEIIWRKDSEADNGVVSEGATTDDSEERPARGRAESRAEEASRKGKSYLDKMPAFTPERQIYRHPHETPSETKSSRRQSVQSGFSDGRKQAFARDVHSPVLESESEHDPEAKDTKEGGRRRPVLPPSLGTRHFSYSQRTNTSRSEKEHLPISRREIARLRALLLSSGVMAMEISRRANTPQPISTTSRPSSREAPIPWAEIAPIAPGELLPESVAPLESYPRAARLLESSIAASSQQWHEKAETFSSETAPALHSRLDALRIKLAVDLSSTIRGASDEADETSREATQTQRLRVKRVVDVIEKMLRRRRRRFRWVRRAMWLGVEWVLVGFMWYVWFVVMVLRIIGSVGRGGVRAVRWLFWL